MKTERKPDWLQGGYRLLNQTDLNKRPMESSPTGNENEISTQQAWQLSPHFEL